MNRPRKRELMEIEARGFEEASSSSGSSSGDSSDSSDSSDGDHSDEEDSEYEGKTEDTVLQRNQSCMSLAERLRLQEEEDISLSSSNQPSLRKRQRLKQKKEDTPTFLQTKEVEKEKERKRLKRLSKNSPSVMPSNRAVKRFRENSNLTKTLKPLDPRFSDLNGKLDYDIFLKSYEFLDAKQEREMKSLEKRIKRTKDETKKTELKSSYHKIKQDLVGRRRHQSFKEKLKKSKEIEKEKVANGKKPYFMKESAKKEMARESRFDDLKESGQLQAFLSKKRKKDAHKDRKRIPKSRRV